MLNILVSDLLQFFTPAPSGTHNFEMSVVSNKAFSEMLKKLH